MPDRPRAIARPTPRTVLRWTLAIAVVLTVLLGGRSLARHLPALESFVDDLGWLGPLAFVGLVIVLTSVFVPDTLLSVAAGVLFGLGWGVAIMITAALITASVDYGLARRLLRDRIHALFDRYPRLAPIGVVARHGGLRLQVLLRLTPISPVAVGYALGAAGTRYRTFLPASLAMTPGIFMEVYFGAAAAHMTSVAGDPAAHSTTRTALKIGGLLLVIVTMALVARAARRTLAEATASDA